MNITRDSMDYLNLTINFKDHPHNCFFGVSNVHVEPSPEKKEYYQLAPIANRWIPNDTKVAIANINNNEILAIVPPLPNCAQRLASIFSERIYKTERETERRESIKSLFEILKNRYSPEIVEIVLASEGKNFQNMYDRAIPISYLTLRQLDDHFRGVSYIESELRSLIKKCMKMSETIKKLEDKKRYSHVNDMEKDVINKNNSFEPITAGMRSVDISLQMMNEIVQRLKVCTTKLDISLTAIPRTQGLNVRRISDSHLTYEQGIKMLKLAEKLANNRKSNLNATSKQMTPMESAKSNAKNISEKEKNISSEKKKKKKSNQKLKIVQISV